MSNVIEMYKASMEGKDEKTIKNDMSAVVNFIKWYRAWEVNTLPSDVSDEQIVEMVTAKAIKDWKDYRQGKAQKPHMSINKPSTEGTLNKSLQRIKRFFSFVESKGINTNPAEKHTAVTVAQVAPKWLKEDEQEEMKRRIKKMYILGKTKPNYRNYTVIMFLLHTGLRIQELCDLKHPNLEKKKEGKEYKYTLHFYGKGGQKRSVKLNKEMRDIYMAYEENHQVKGEYLFDSERSTKMTTRAIQHIIAEVCKELSFTFTAHQLRHTFIKNLMIEAPKHQMSIELIGRVAGHFHKDGSVNISQTMRYGMSTAEEAADITDILSSY
jgi:site-specific recombinase XerD